MSVSTKAPTSRSGGGTTPPPGPIPAPRVVGNRRVRAGGIALAVMLLLLGAVLSAVALLSASRTSSYLVFAKQVDYGSQITRDDFKTVELSGGRDLKLIQASSINAVIGLYAAATLEPGALAVVPDFMHNPIASADQTTIAVPVKFTNMPAVFKPGDQIGLVVLGTGPNAAQEFPATVVDVKPWGNDGSVKLSVAVPASQAAELATLNTFPGLSVVLIKAQG